VPSNPDTIPGFSGNVYLDEFALHKDDWGIWRAAVPAVTRGYGVRVASTHRGRKTKFFELTRNKAYSHHRTTIHDAIREGLLLKDEDGNIRTVDSLRELVADPMVWLEEYELDPQDDATAWLTWELIRAAEDEYVDPSPEWASRLVHQAVKARKHYKLAKADPPWWQTKPGTDRASGGGRRPPRPGHGHRPHPGSVRDLAAAARRAGPFYHSRHHHGAYAVSRAALRAA
jgi:phage FluMu gp28-like protein